MILQMKYNELMKARQYFLCIYHVVPYESDKPYVDTSMYNKIVKSTQLGPRTMEWNLIVEFFIE